MSHLTPYAQQILDSAASFGVPAPAATTVSEADMISQLQRENERLQAEADGAKGRAAHRHQEMMHANRRAERAENALERHDVEQKAEEAKVNRLWVAYTQTIENLEARIESQEIQSQKEAKEDHVKIVAETEERLRKQFQDEIGAMKSQFQAALKALHNQVQELKKQVHQATQREVAQTSQIATGVHAGDLKQHQQVATAPVSAGENKRKRQNSTGDTASALPEPKKSRPAPTASRAQSTAPRAKTPAAKTPAATAPAATRAPRRPSKPSQPPKTSAQQMGTSKYPQNSVQTVDSQALQPLQQQAISFQQYFQGVNNRRLAQGLPTMSQSQARKDFGEFVQRINQESARLTFDRGGIAPAMQQQTPKMTLGQGVTQPNTQPSASINPNLTQFKPMQFGQDLGASQNFQSPWNGQGVQFGTFQFQSPQKMQQQQPLADLQGNGMSTSQFSAMPNLGWASPTLSPTVEHAVDPSMLSSSGPSAFPSLGNQDMQNFNSLGQDGNDRGLYTTTPIDLDGFSFSFNDPTLQQVTGENNSSGPTEQAGTSAPPASASAQAGLPSQQNWLSGVSIDPSLKQSAAQNPSINPAGTTSASPAPPVPTLPQVPPQVPAVNASPAHSAPAPVPSTPAPIINDLLKPCLNCFEHWWGTTCDPGEPCFNCQASGAACERPLCHNDAAGCTNKRCYRVHTNDGSGYANVVARPKTLKRRGTQHGRSWSPREVKDGVKSDW